MGGKSYQKYREKYKKWRLVQRPPLNDWGMMQLVIAVQCKELHSAAAVRFKLNRGQGKSNADADFVVD